MTRDILKRLKKLESHIAQQPTKKKNFSPIGTSSCSMPSLIIWAMPDQQGMPCWHMHGRSDIRIRLNFLVTFESTTAQTFVRGPSGPRLNC